MDSSSERAQALYSHLAEGTTTTCRCWLVERRDGWTRGFTDHDGDLVIDGVVFGASSGFTASALEATTGMAVDNSEVVGALNDAGLSEEDIEAGRFDGAKVTIWLVNWADTAQRSIRFRASIGEVSRNDGAFSAELRGMTEALNQPRGRVFQSECSAVLGDRSCRFDLEASGYSTELIVTAVEDARVFRVANPDGYAEGWFERGRLKLMDGTGAGLAGWIKNDQVLGGGREITLWNSLRAGIAAGDTVRLEAGCDKRAATCTGKFSNFLNFRGCPHIPGEDWLTSYPRKGKKHDGGSMNAPITS